MGNPLLIPEIMMRTYSFLYLRDIRQMMLVDKYFYECAIEDFGYKLHKEYKKS